MIDWVAVACSVFVDDSKGRRGYDIFNSQFFADSLDKSCLSGTHLAIEGKNVAITHMLQKLFCSNMNVF